MNTPPEVGGFFGSWRRAGAPGPLGIWRVSAESTEELELRFDGDPEGDLPTTTVQLARKCDVFRLCYYLEFAVILAHADLAGLAEDFEIVSTWERDTPGLSALLLDASNDVNTGGSFVWVNDKVSNCVLWIASARGEDHQVRYALSRRTVTSLSEMISYAVKWLARRPKASGA